MPSFLEAISIMPNMNPECSLRREVQICCKSSVVKYCASVKESS
jgi:hypothetical protein